MELLYRDCRSSFLTLMQNADEVRPILSVMCVKYRWGMKNFVNRPICGSEMMRNSNIAMELK